MPGQFGLHPSGGDVREPKCGRWRGQPNADDPGGVLGDFRIVREVGKGGMGVVYEAEQISLRRRVALKVLPFAATLDARHLQRFQNEAQAAACLHHTNIVPVFFVGCERGVHFYAMQYIDGQPLSELIRQMSHSPRLAGGYETVSVADLTPLTGESHRGRSFFHKLAELGVQVAEALHHAHQLGIVHRDIKPANLLLDGRGNLWVTDFGLARMRHGEANLTLTGQALGTPRYMSPEQAMAKRLPIDHRTDVYSLDVTLYELLTLRPAFFVEDHQELLRQIAFEEPAALRRLNRAIPRELEIIVLKAMAKEPADRYETARELADDLRRFVEDKPIKARRPSWLLRVRRWFRRHQVAVTAAAMTLAGTMAVSTVLIWREREETLSALHDVKVQRERAEERELHSRRQLYAAHIAAAQRAWRVAELRLMKGLLEQHIPRPGEEDPRGWEWYYLWGLLQGRREALRTLRGHNGDVYCVQFSPDGRLLATAGKDHTIRLWDAATGEQRAVLHGHSDEVNWVAFAPDGRSLASAGEDGAVKLWDVASGRETGQILKGSVEVVGVAYSPDGKLLAAGLEGGTVRWWDRPSGRERPAFRAHDKRIESITFSPDGKTLATCAETAVLWDVATGKLRRLLPEPRLHMKVIRFSHRGDMVAAPSYRGTLQLWDTASGHQLLNLANTDGIFESAAFSPDDRILATAFSSDDRMQGTAAKDPAVRLWDARNGRMLDQWTAHPDRVWCVAFSPDGRTLATTGGDGTVRLWDPSARHFRKVLPSTAHIHPMAFSPDGKRLFGGGYRNREVNLNVLEIPSGRLEASVQIVEPIYGLTAALDGRTLATGHLGGSVTVWDLNAMRPRLTFQAEENREGSRPAVGRLAFTLDNKTLLTYGSNRVLRQWDVSTGKFLCALPSSHDQHWGLAYSPRANIVAMSAPQKSVVLWDLVSNSSRSLPWAEWCFVDSFSPDGTLLAGFLDNSLILFDLAAQRAIHPSIRHRGNIALTAFSPDGKTVASLGIDGELKLWSAATGQKLLSLEEHTGPIKHVAFSPDGRTLAVSSLLNESEEVVSLWLTPEGPLVAEPSPSGVKEAGH